MFKIILRLLKYINIIVAVFILFSIFKFCTDYFFNSEKEKQLEEVRNTIKRNDSEIEILKELIETRTKVNQQIIEESFAKDEEIALKIKEILIEILDKEIGLFKITNINHKVDDSYINLYRTTIEILFTQNKLFTFYDLQSDILKENNSIDTNFHLKIESFAFNDSNSTLSLTLLTKKNVNTKVLN
jgi:hypothetical protein